VNWANTRYGLNLKEKDLKKFAQFDKGDLDLDRMALEEFLTEKAGEMVAKVDLDPAREFLQEDWGRRSLAGWLHHKFGIAVDAAEWSNLSKDEIAKRVQSLARKLYAQKEAEFPVRVGMSRFLHERTQTQPARYDREGLAAWASQRFHTLVDAEELQLKLRPEIEALLLEVAQKHYEGAKVAEQLEEQITAAFGPNPAAPSWCRPRPIPRPSAT